jgi:uncharacterized surface protein with fasciclin (FAS1) repeats
MKNLFSHYQVARVPILQFHLIVFISLLFSFCTQEPSLWSVKSSEQVASDYIKSKPEFSEFAKLMEMTGLEPLLGIRGPYTIMLPNNDAMFAYYKEKGVNSLTDFDEKFLSNMILNHLITDEISSGDIGLGALRDTNAIGDFLVTEFQGSDIIVNKQSKIIDQDVQLANGYAHVIDRVIEPITKDIYTVIAEDPSYKIFTEGLVRTGIKDTLQLISFPYGNSTARTRFTVLAVPDTIYQKYGINNVDDLIKLTGGNPDSLTYLNNPFYRYMEYHCLNGTHYLNGLNSQLYPILSYDNNVSMTVDTDYKINLLPKTQKYTAFIVPASNTPAKNGALHAINDILPVIQPEPQVVIFETTDFFDLKQGDYFGKYYMKFSDGQNTFAKIKWTGDFLQYYYKPSETANMHYDCLNMYGWWTLSVTFPKVMKGNYKISIFQPSWGDVTTCAAYLDGVMTKYSYTGPKAGGTGGLQQIADGYFTTTAEHTITLRNTFFGGCWWDYVRFDPVK